MHPSDITTSRRCSPVQRSAYVKIPGNSDDNLAMSAKLAPETSGAQTLMFGFFYAKEGALLHGSDSR